MLSLLAPPRPAGKITVPSGAGFGFKNVTQETSAPSPLRVLHAYRSGISDHSPPSSQPRTAGALPRPATPPQPPHGPRAAGPCCPKRHLQGEGGPVGSRSCSGRALPPLVLETPQDPLTVLGCAGHMSRPIIHPRGPSEPRDCWGGDNSSSPSIAHACARGAGSHGHWPGSADTPSPLGRGFAAGRLDLWTAARCSLCVCRPCTTSAAPRPRCTPGTRPAVAFVPPPCQFWLFMENANIRTSTTPGVWSSHARFTLRTRRKGRVFHLQFWKHMGGACQRAAGRAARWPRGLQPGVPTAGLAKSGGGDTRGVAGC